MASVRDLARRIRSVKSTQQITRAMKLVAASKLRRAQDDMEKARPYAGGIRHLLSNVLRRAGSEAHPLMERREGDKTLLVIITADRGLCGGFNANVIKEATRFLTATQREVSLQLVGRKGAEFFKKRPYPIRGSSSDTFRRLDFEVSRALAGDLVKAFVEEDFSEVLLLSNRFRTVMAQDVVLERLLPAGEPPAEPEAESVEYVYEPDADALLEAILPRSIEALVHQALLESYAAEMGARMVAMESATSNAAEMIDHLTLVMNRKRQAAITTEIIEVVSGAAALDE